MQITIKGETRYIPVSTVTLQKAGEGVTYPFHCVTCGNTCNIIGGKVTKIYPILEPSNQIPVLSTCKSCKSKYVFQDSNEDSIAPVIVLLNPTQSMQSFYCYLGGGENKNMNRILDYDTGQIFSYYENKSIHPPYISRCTNTSCTLIYQFTHLS